MSVFLGTESAGLGLGTWELVLIIAAPIAIVCFVLMVFFSLRHQKKRLTNRRMNDTEHNMDSADVPILGNQWNIQSLYAKNWLVDNLLCNRAQHSWWILPQGYDRYDYKWIGIGTSVVGPAQHCPPNSTARNYRQRAFWRGWSSFCLSPKFHSFESVNWIRCGGDGGVVKMWPSRSSHRVKKDLGSARRKFIRLLCCDMTTSLDSSLPITKVYINQSFSLWLSVLCIVDVFE